MCISDECVRYILKERHSKTSEGFF